MNNLFLEGPIQTGKSTLIREILKNHFGNSLDGLGGFTVQRVAFPTQGEDKRFGFRLMEASAPISAHTCVVATDEDLISSDGVFKVVGSGHGLTDMSVFETKAITLMQHALDDARAGRIRLILLDEIGGHELAIDAFREKLYEVLDSDVPCIGVIKLEDSLCRMTRRIASEEAELLLQHNRELHKKITGEDNSAGEILYFERDNSDTCKADQVRTKLETFIDNL